MKIKIAAENPIEWIAARLNLAPLPLLETQIYFIVARAIMAGADLGIFAAIGKGTLTGEEIAGKCKTSKVATCHLLDCLVGLGYLKWKKGSYSITPKYQKWLLPDSEFDLTGKLRFQLYEWKIFDNLEDYVRTGKALDLHSSLSPEIWSSYQEGMRDISKNAAKESAGKIKFKQTPHKMLDIGGSHGLYSIQLCKKHASLQSTILELPGAIDRASEIAAAYGMGDRVKYKAGNALTDDLGEGVYDLIMVNNLVHHFTHEENMMFAKKVARALKPGGLFIIGESIRKEYPGEGGTVGGALGLQFALTSASGTWSVQEINAWQLAAGLSIKKPISLMTLPGFQLVVAEKE